MEEIRRDGSPAEEPKILTKEAIWESSLEEGSVNIPKWGGAVRIRELTKQQQGWCRAQARSKAPEVEFDDDLFADAIFQSGCIEPLFTREEIARLREKSAESYDTIVLAIMNISGLTTEAIARAKRSFRTGG